MKAALAGLAGLLGASALWAADPAPGERVSFVSCPIVRDTSTVPCWLADYQGVRYFLTLQTGRSPTLDVAGWSPVARS